jgi:hypothetical protein
MRTYIFGSNQEPTVFHQAFIAVGIAAACTAELWFLLWAGGHVISAVKTFGTETIRLLAQGG